MPTASPAFRPFRKCSLSVYCVPGPVVRGKETTNVLWVLDTLLRSGPRGLMLGPGTPHKEDRGGPRTEALGGYALGRPSPMATYDSG